MYFEHEGTGEILVIKKGDSLAFLEKDIFDEWTKAQYDAWAKGSEPQQESQVETETQREEPTKLNN